MQIADSEVGSGLCEKMQLAPAVQVPCLKNLHGTCDKLEANITRMMNVVILSLFSPYPYLHLLWLLLLLLLFCFVGGGEVV